LRRYGEAVIAMTAKTAAEKMEQLANRAAYAAGAKAAGKQLGGVAGGWIIGFVQGLIVAWVTWVLWLALSSGAVMLLSPGTGATAGILVYVTLKALWGLATRFK